MVKSLCFFGGSPSVGRQLRCHAPSILVRGSMSVSVQQVEHAVVALVECTSDRGCKPSHVRLPFVETRVHTYVARAAQTRKYLSPYVSPSEPNHGNHLKKGRHIDRCATMVWWKYTLTYIHIESSS
jgi:hypothetical protein